MIFWQIATFAEYLENVTFMTALFDEATARSAIVFTKMHGAGNDYIYIDCMQSMPDRPEELAVEMASRHFGVGGDGIVLICPSEVADLKMRMFNSDGSEGKMCGNASRCIALYAANHGLADSDTINLETLSGVKVLLINRNADGTIRDVTVDMGKPETTASLVPAKAQTEQMIDYPLRVDGETLSVTAVSMGNPHCVVFVDRLENVDFFRLGPILETHEAFPERANVEFVEVVDRDHVKVRVWERGSGETLACGTGACAVAVAGSLTERTGDNVKVSLRGGDLSIAIDPATGHVLMTGPAEEVFSGVYHRKH